VGDLLEMRKDRGTIESVHKCVLYHLRGRPFFIFLYVNQMLMEIGTVVYWRIREWEFRAGVLGTGNYIPVTFQKAKGMRTTDSVLICNAF
jgi:hypothetical protein